MRAHCSAPSQVGKQTVRTNPAVKKIEKARQEKKVLATRKKAEEERKRLSRMSPQQRALVKTRNEQLYYEKQQKERKRLEAQRLAASKVRARALKDSKRLAERKREETKKKGKLFVA